MNLCASASLRENLTGMPEAVEPTGSRRADGVRPSIVVLFLLKAARAPKYNNTRPDPNGTKFGTTGGLEPRANKFINS